MLIDTTNFARIVKFMSFKRLFFYFSDMKEFNNSSWLPSLYPQVQLKFHPARNSSIFLYNIPNCP